MTGGDDGIRAIARTGGVRPRARWTARDFIANYLCKNELRMSSETVSTMLCTAHVPSAGFFSVEQGAFSYICYAGTVGLTGSGGS